MTKSPVFPRDPVPDGPRPLGLFQKRPAAAPDAQGSLAPAPQPMPTPAQAQPPGSGIRGAIVAGQKAQEPAPELAAPAAPPGEKPARASSDPTAADTQPAVTPHPGITATYTLGISLIVCGIGLILVWSAGDRAGNLRPLMEHGGLAPIDLVLVGLVLAGCAGLRRRQHQHQLDIAYLMDTTELASALSEQTHAQLGYLVESEVTRADSTRGVADEMQQTLHLIKRQDEKINNLSKATKMYGKPLLEITNQISESSHQICEMGSTLNAVKIILEQSSTRLEQTVRNELLRKPEGAGAAPSAELAEAIKTTREMLRGLEALQRETARGLAQRSDKLATDLAGSAKQILDQIGAVKGELGETVAARADKLADELAQLDRRVEHSRAALMAGIKQLVTQHEQTGSPELSETLKRIQLEVSQLAVDVASIRTEPAPRPIGPATTAPRPAASVAAPSATATEEPPAEPAPEPVAGTKPSSGAKNVLSAIAKLKSLRT